jgi:O-acetyl-ADP-ribose deacetylase (regulator of RNase III)
MQRVIQVIQGDITRLDVEAVVNAARESLLGGGGVDGAIHRAAGPGLLDECKAIPEIEPGVRCATGEAILTHGHNLPARFVIHTVGPVWQGGRRDEDETLARSYRNVLRLAAVHGFSSIAIPAISTGAYGFPLERAAAIAVREVSEFARKDSFVQRILLVCYDHDAKRAFDRAVQDDRMAREQDGRGATE